MKNKFLKPVLVSTSAGSFLLTAQEAYKELFFDGKEWNILSNKDSFFPVKIDRTFFYMEDIKTAKLIDNYLVCSTVNVIQIYKFPKMEQIYEFKNFEKYSLSNKYLAIQYSGKVQIYTLPDFKDHKIIDTTGILCGITNYFMNVYDLGIIKTIDIQTLNCIETEAELQSICFNNETMITGNDRNLELYRSEENKWFLSKKISIANTKKSSFVISDDSETIVVATYKKEEDKIIQLLQIYTYNGTNYNLQNTLSFGVFENENLQFLQISDSG